jgi:hypothetical protein
VTQPPPAPWAGRKFRHRLRAAWREFNRPDAEADRLRAEVAALGIARDSAQAIAEQRSAERDGYAAAWRAVCAERDAARGEAASQQAASQGYEAAWRATAAERDAALAAAAQAGAERAGFEAAWRETCAERDALHFEAAAQRAQRDGFEAAWRETCAERDTRHFEAAERQAQRDGFEAAWRATCAERDALRFAAGQAGAERDGFRIAFDSVTLSMQAVNHELAMLGRSADPLPPPGPAGRPPGVLIITLPKSGTVYSQNKLLRSFDLRTRQVCGGCFPSERIDPVALGLLKGGGRLAMSHVPASAENIATLKQAGLRFVVHLRDPRAATLSMLHHIRTYQADPTMRHFLVRIGIDFPDGFLEAGFAEQLDTMVELYLPAAVHWAEGWLAAIEADPAIARLAHLTRFEDLAGDEDHFLREICGHVGLPAEGMDFAAVARDAAAHFRQGDDAAWRHEMTAAQAARADALLPAGLRARMGWS